MLGELYVETGEISQFRDRREAFSKLLPILSIIFSAGLHQFLQLIGALLVHECFDEVQRITIFTVFKVLEALQEIKKTELVEDAEFLLFKLESLMKAVIVGA